MNVPSGETYKTDKISEGNNKNDTKPSLNVEEGATLVCSDAPSDIVNNDNPRTGLDQSIYAVENDDLAFSGDVYLAGSLVIPSDKSLTFRSGSTLDLSGKTLTVEGTLIIESGAEVFGLGGENIILAAGGSIQNNGVIGYGSEVTVKTESADGGSVTMMNIEGISFGIETTYSGATPSYALTVTGDVYATAGDFNEYTLDIDGAKIVGDFTTDTETAVNATGAVITNGATYTMEGTLTGSVKMTEGSTIIITGTANGTDIVAETGNFATADKTNNDKFAYATSKVVLTDVTDVELYVAASTYTKDKVAMTEQALYIRGTTSYVGEETSGTIDITNTDVTGDYSNEAVVKVAEGDILALDKETTFNGDGIIVLGQIQVGDKDASKVSEFVGTKYTILDASDRTKGTTYITNFEAALDKIAEADKQTITVFGEVTVDTSFVLADGQTIALSTSDIAAKMTIGTDAKVELQKGSKITGTIEEVQGILYVYKGGVLSNEPTKYAVSTTNKSTGDVMYAGLEAAIANSQAGDVITVVAKGYADGVKVENNLTIPADRTVVVDSGKKVVFTKNLTIDEGATLTNKGTVEMAGTKAVVTVNGTFDNVAGTLDANSDANVNANGQYVITYAATFPDTTYAINGAYYGNDGKYIVTTFAKAVAATGALEGDQPVTVIGKISESGDVTVDTDTVTINGDAVLGNITIDNADLVINAGKSLTATVIGAYGADGSTSDASISLSKATDMTVSNYSKVDNMNVTNWYNSIDAVNGNVTISSGEVVFIGSGNVTADSKSVLKVASGATLVVDADAALVLGDAEFLTVEGTVIVESPVTFDANVTIDGTIDIRDTVTVNGTATLTVTGSMVVSSDEENPGELDLQGRLNVGKTPELVSGTASGTVSGEVTVNGGMVVVYNGASVSDATIADMTGTALKSTTFVVNGYSYATVYGNAYVSSLDGEIYDLKDIKGDSKNGSPAEWYADGSKIENPTTTAVGDYAEVSTTLAWEDVKFTVSVGPGLEVYIDDLRVEGVKDFAVGEHKITVFIKPNYEGTPEITLNGQTISGDSFTVTADMIDGENIIYVSGVTPADSTVVIDGGNNGDDGLGLTDILLIILVVLIVIMAIMVAMRLMRS